MKPDFQAEEPSIPLSLSNVGVENVRAWTLLGDKIYDFDIRIDLSLPSHQRGVHMSRFYEGVSNSIQKIVELKVDTPSKFASLIAEEVLRGNPYADLVKVLLSTHFIYWGDTNDVVSESPDPNKKLSQEYANLVIEIERGHNGNNHFGTSIGIIGSSYCPCGEHQQRVDVFVKVTTQKFLEVPYVSLISVAEHSCSAPTREYLKRDDEQELVQRAKTNPRFVEDIARTGLILLYKQLKKIGFDSSVLLDLNTELGIDVRSYESIHRHNCTAKSSMSFRDLEDLVQNHKI